MRVAEIGADGQLIFPARPPHCRRDGPPNRPAPSLEVDHDELAVIC